MALPELCERCGRECDEDSQCLAIKMLYKLYTEERTAEKREILKELREILELVDYEPAEDIKDLAEKLITSKSELSFINEFNIKVGYVRAYESKTKSGRVTYAECRKINGSYLAYLPFDFVITIYEPNTAWLTDNQIKVVVYHELRHITITERGLAVKPHDIEDFESILRQHGLNWSEPGNEVIDILGGGGNGEEKGNRSKRMAAKRQSNSNGRNVTKSRGSKAKN